MIAYLLALLVVGQFHCITRWLKTRSTCPLDDEEWSVETAQQMDFAPSCDSLCIFFLFSSCSGISFNINRIHRASSALLLVILVRSSSNRPLASFVGVTSQRVRSIVLYSTQLATCDAIDHIFWSPLPYMISN
ncbi:MAG: hypothetical protein Q7T57_09315, partial [Dehalococcoidales bacterium]|nr:hypothetical protein [Dehalococcoidales bacterium]